MARRLSAAAQWWHGAPAPQRVHLFLTFHRRDNNVDWSNERYVRLYTRDTETVLLEPWQSRALFREMLRKADRAGVIECRTRTRGLAVIVGMPLDVVIEFLPPLLEDGTVSEHPDGYVIPNFIEAQESAQSDKQRQKESRQRRRDRARHNVTKPDAEDPKRDEVVTKREETVTSGHSVPSRAVPSQAKPDQPATPLRIVTEPTVEPEPEPVDVSKAARDLTIAANQAITARYGEQIRPLLPGTGVALAQSIVDSGIPIAFAATAVRTLVANRTASEPPGSMSWFARGVARLWQEDQARKATAATSIGSVLSQPPRTVLDAFKAGARGGART